MFNHVLRVILLSYGGSRPPSTFIPAARGDPFIVPRWPHSFRLLSSSHPFLSDHTHTITTTARGGAGRGTQASRVREKDRERGG